MNGELIIKYMFPIIFACFGLIFILYPIIKYGGVKRRCTSKTSGKVVKMDWDVSLSSLDKDEILSRYVCFEYYAGKKKVFQRARIEGSGLKVGQDVTVFYNPKNHDDYYVLENKARGKIYIGFIIMGIIFLGVALFNYLNIK